MKILIIDDGTTTRANKTRMYDMFAQSRGADVTKERLQNLDDPLKLLGYDVILTDLDGKSSVDNKAFLDMLELAYLAGARPSVKMFSGYFNGVESDLPTSIPSILKDAVTTHADTTATKVIIAAIDAIGKTDKPRAI